MGLLDRFVAREERSGEQREHIKRRLDVIPTHDLPAWADTLITQAGRSFHAYVRDGDPAQLAETKMALEGLETLVDEVERRFA